MVKNLVAAKWLTHGAVFLAVGEQAMNSEVMLVALLEWEREKALLEKNKEKQEGRQ